jgi:hypothetical protein
VRKILPNLHAVYEGSKRARFEITVTTPAAVMGQSVSSPFSNSLATNQLIDTGQWEMMLDCVGHDAVVDVKLESGNNPFKHKYVVKYNSMIPPNCIMTLIFPLHPDASKRILWTTGDLSALSYEINARIKESLVEPPKSQLVVTSGDTFYRFHGNIGTLYLVWAERLNQITVNNQNRQIAEDIPLLIELDRKWGYRSFFIFGNSEVTALGDIQKYEPFHYPIFCCETDPREEVVRKIDTVNNSHADRETSELVTVSALDGVAAPFADT